MKNYKDLLEEVRELNDTYCIIEGIVDIENKSIVINTLNYWLLIGKDFDNAIEDCLLDYTIDEDDGEYFFVAVLELQDYSYSYEYGYEAYHEVKYIEFKFQQTFLQRQRQEKLDMLSFDFENILK